VFKSPELFGAETVFNEMKIDTNFKRAYERGRDEK